MAAVVDARQENGTAGSSTEIVLALGSLLDRRNSVAVEPIVGIQSIVSEIVKERTMEGVGTGSGL